MYNLVIDVGNTSTKVAVFKEQVLIELLRYEHPREVDLEQLMAKYAIVNSSLSDVGGDSDALISFLHSKTRYVPFSTMLGGITNHYGTPGTLGTDRWAKLVAAYASYKGSNCLIIDSGTCITCDLLTASGEYFGGTISPGIHMRFKALHTYTGKLPLVEWDKEAGIPEGDNTENAIRAGVLKGYLNEVSGYIAEYDSKYEDLKILLSGGDAGFLFLRLKSSIFAPRITEDPLLVLKGLNEVIRLETCT